MVGHTLSTVIVAALALFSTPITGLAIEPIGKRQDANHWVDTWTSMPQLVESSNMPPSPFVCTHSLNFLTTHDT
jgi:hypothetical protein